MPILHSCKACGSKVTESDVQGGKALRKGAAIYCSECSQLILEPVEALPGRVAQEHLVSSPAAQKSPRLAIPNQGSGGVAGSSGIVQIGSSMDPPTGKQDPLSRNGIEIVEEFEILSGNDDVPDLDKEFGDRDQEVEDKESAIDTNPSEPPARPEEAPGPLGGSRRNPRQRQRLAGGAGPRASARGSERPSSMRGAHARGASRRERSLPKAPEPPKNHKEIFFKSSSRNAKAADQVKDKHAECVDSNVLQSVRDLRDSKRRPSKSSIPRMGKSRAEEASSSSKQSRRGSVRQPAQNNNTYIIAGGVAALVLIFVLVLAMSGKSASKPAGKGAVSTSVEDNQPSSYYAQKAHELLNKGDQYGAADMFCRAADAAERSGNSEEAVRFNQAAINLKFKVSQTKFNASR